MFILLKYLYDQVLERMVTKENSYFEEKAIK